MSLTIWAAPIKSTEFPVFVAVMVVIPEVPPMLRVALAAWVIPPVPSSAVPTVSVLLLVRVIVVTVILGSEKVPVSAWLLVLKVWRPVPAVKTPLLMMPPANVTGELVLLFQVPALFTVTSPVKVLVPVELFSNRVPVTPVVPVTANPVVKLFRVNTPAVMVRLPATVVVPLPVMVAP